MQFDARYSVLGTTIYFCLASPLAIACNDSGNNSVNNSLTIHQCNLQLLMIEIFKTKNNLTPIFMKDIFAAKIAK